MGYVIAAYGIVFASLIAYGVHLARERRALEGEDNPPSPEGNRDRG